MNDKNSILVVDDEPNGFDVIEAHLYREGYELIYASSGIEALSQLKTLEADAILLDVMMPQMDGIEVCRRLKSDSGLKHIPIIMVTALNSKEELARAIEAGADDFLTKPVSGIELRARVRSMLRIKQQYDELQAMVTLREDLSNMIVHDLRNPLTKIMVCSSLLIDGVLDDEELQSIQIIASAGHQLNSMINDLLLQAKMQAGKMILNRSYVNLNDLILEAVSEFKSVANSKKLHLKTQLPEQSEPVSVDANLFRRLIDNLLSNAHKFSPKESTITLQVEYLIDEALGNKKRTAHKPKVIIRVADQGNGVQEDLKQRIFDKYEVGKAIEGVSQLGLGLTFCKMVVEAHKGTIFVEDNKPKGSIFTVIV